MPLELKLVLVDCDARRSFSNTIKRCQPAIIDLQTRIASFSLPGEGLTEIVGFFADNPTSWIEVFEGDLPTSLSFNAGYGTDREFHRTLDQEFLRVIASQCAAAIQSSRLTGPTREAICEAIHSWVDDLPRHFPERVRKRKSS